MHTNTIVVLKQYHKNSKTLSGKISVVLDLARNVLQAFTTKHLPYSVMYVNTMNDHLLPNFVSLFTWPFTPTFCLAIYSHFLLGHLCPLFAVYEHYLCVNACG